MDRETTNTRAATGIMEQPVLESYGNNSLTLEELRETEGELCAAIDRTRMFGPKLRKQIIRQIRSRFQIERAIVTAVTEVRNCGKL